MAYLFPPLVQPDDIPDIPGLSYRPEYISVAEEKELVVAIDNGEWDQNWQRRRQLFGASYGNTDAQRPLPSWSRNLVERLWANRIGDRRFDQLLVNEYLPGQGIAIHRDYLPFGRTVVSLSLLSECVMDFRDPAIGTRYSLLLEPRSLLILSDQARYEWQHGIARRKNDRWKGQILRRGRRLSVTLRLRRDPAAAD